MEVLDIERNEVANCKVVRWLLDPIARHGIGAQLLWQLAEAVDFQITTTSSYAVATEVSREETRADIVVTGLDGEVLVIEAKIDAGEQRMQAARLEQRWPEASRFVFVTPQGTRTPWTAADQTRWRPLSWNWFADRAVRLINNHPTNDPAMTQSHSSIRSWAHTIRRNQR